ncbi:hypothetical protein F4677DRAFT_300172 [Hypoxylon crocopeplum]|nr:hypothetical protein F4677DRAFT_300172 [Hypoxylon crocopeplum]
MSAMFSCGHELPKSRVGANLAHTPQDSSNRCPDCQTSSPVGLLSLLKNLEDTCEADEPLDENISLYLITYTFHRFVSQRKAPEGGFKRQFDTLLYAWGETCHCLLDRKQILSFYRTAKGRWGSDIAKLALRAVGTAALKANGVHTSIPPENAEILATVNRMIELMKERARSIESFEQLLILLNGAAMLRMLRGQVTFALVQLEEGYTRWDAAGK